jgi:hypothetical protein
MTTNRVEGEAEEAGLAKAKGYAPSPFMREVAALALACGDSYTSLAEAKGYQHISTVSGHFESPRPHVKTREWYAKRYGIGEEYAALVEGRPLSEDRFRHWAALIESWYWIPGAPSRFEHGTREKLRAAGEERPQVYRRAVEAFALERYREDAGLYPRGGKRIISIGPGWYGLPSDRAFVETLREVLDLTSCVRRKPNVDGVLSGIASRLHDGGCTDAQTDAVLEVVRTMLRANGQDLTVAEVVLNETRAILSRKGQS